jgi:hypothetical protein
VRWQKGRVSESAVIQYNYAESARIKFDAPTVSMENSILCWEFDDSQVNVSFPFGWGIDVAYGVTNFEICLNEVSIYKIGQGSDIVNEREIDLIIERDDNQSYYFNAFRREIEVGENTVRIRRLASGHFGDSDWTEFTFVKLPNPDLVITGGFGQNVSLNNLDTYAQYDVSAMLIRLSYRVDGDLITMTELFDFDDATSVVITPELIHGLFDIPVGVAFSLAFAAMGDGVSMLNSSFTDRDASSNAAVSELNIISPENLVLENGILQWEWEGDIPEGYWSRTYFTVRVITEDGAVHDFVYSHFYMIDCPNRETVYCCCGSSSWVECTANDCDCDEDERVENLDFRFPLPSMVTQAGIYQVMVRTGNAELGWFASPFSNALSITQLAAPTNLRVEGNVIRWNAVDNAIPFDIEAGIGGYVLIIDGVAITPSGTTSHVLSAPPVSGTVIQIKTAGHELVLESVLASITV